MRILDKGYMNSLGFIVLQSVCEEQLLIFIDFPTLVCDIWMGFAKLYLQHIEFTQRKPFQSPNHEVRSIKSCSTATIQLSALGCPPHNLINT